MCKILKPLIVLSVVTAFTISAVLCCCAIQVVHASSMKSTDKMASDPCQGDCSPQKKSNSHGYCFLKAPSADKVLKFTTAIPSLYDVFHFQETIISFGRGIHQVSSLKRTAYGGVFLSRVESVPLYLYIRNLRL